MSINKSIQYDVFDTNGEIVQTKLLFSLKIATKSGNYLLHKDILRHQLNKKQGTVSTKQEVKLEVVVKTLASKRYWACKSWIKPFTIMERWWCYFWSKTK